MGRTNHNIEKENIMTQATENLAYDLSVSTHKYLICWRSILAGFAVSLLTFVGLLGLGLASGGIGLDQDTTASEAGIFAGTWVMISAIVSSLVGGYTSVCAVFSGAGVTAASQSQTFWRNRNNEFVF
jgi:hypothetical protein